MWLSWGGLMRSHRRRGCEEGEIYKTLLVPKNKPLCIVTPMLWCPLGQGFSVTCMMKKESWFKSCHRQKTQYCINSTLVICINSMQTTLSGSGWAGCESNCHIPRQLNWFVFAFLLFLMCVENKRRCFSISLLCKGPPYSTIFWLLFGIWCELWLWA